MARSEQRSLFGEILDWMLAPLLLLWPMSVAITWLVAQSIANHPYDRELAQMIAEILRRLVESDDRIIAAERQQDDAGTVPAKRRVAFERARQNLGSQK